jgi:hypothetical protein
VFTNVLEFDLLFHMNRLKLCVTFELFTWKEQLFSLTINSHGPNIILCNLTNPCDLDVHTFTSCQISNNFQLICGRKLTFQKGSVFVTPIVHFVWLYGKVILQDAKKLSLIQRY